MSCIKYLPPPPIRKVGAADSGPSRRALFLRSIPRAPLLLPASSSSSSRSLWAADSAGGKTQRALRRPACPPPRGCRPGPRSLRSSCSKPPGSKSDARRLFPPAPGTKRSEVALCFPPPPPCPPGTPVTMTAIAAQTQWLLTRRRPKKSFFETFIRSLIILCVAIAIVLLSIAVCDGHWLFTKGKLFGLWHFCTLGSNSTLKCTTDLSLTNIRGISIGMTFIRSTVSFAIVVAIFGLELLMVSQVCEDINSRRKWSMGSVFILVSFLLSSAGMVSFLILLRDYITITSFTLTYWCEFIATFLFFLNGISGLHLNNLTFPWNRVRKN